MTVSHLSVEGQLQDSGNNARERERKLLIREAAFETILAQIHELQEGLSSTVQLVHGVFRDLDRVHRIRIGFGFGFGIMIGFRFEIIVRIGFEFGIMIG